MKKINDYDGNVLWTEGGMYSRSKDSERTEEVMIELSKNSLLFFDYKICHHFKENFGFFFH